MGKLTLSYQFFGKVNDPDTAKYYEQFFEIIKIPTTSISRSSGMTLESRITKGEKEVSKRRAGIFFRLKPGEFVTFADGKDRKVQFRLTKIEKTLPESNLLYSEDELRWHHEGIYGIIKALF